MTKVFFILASTIFFLFVVNVAGNMGQTVISGFTPSALTPSNTTVAGVDPLSSLFYVTQNLAVFFQLMFISSEWFLFGSIIIGGYVIAMLWAILEIIRGV